MPGIDFLPPAGAPVAPGIATGVLPPGVVFPTIPNNWDSSTIGAKNHTVFFFETNWINDTGILQIPVSGPLDTPCEIVSLSGGSWSKVVTWVAACEGAMPSLPSDAPVNPANEFIKWRVFNTQAPSLMIDGKNYVYMMRGYYWYLLLTKPDFTKVGQPLGRQPWDGGPQQYLTAANFDSHATGVGPTPTVTPQGTPPTQGNNRITIPSP